MRFVYKSSIDNSLLRYIDISIVNKYSRFDNAHNSDHVFNVIKNSFEICSCLNKDINLSMVYTIAAYHDIGLMYGRETHETTSAQFLLNDAKLKKWFSDSQIIEMAEAIADHRASNKNEPRNLYGKIIADADRDVDYITVLTRTIKYGLSNYPSYSIKRQWIRTREHLDEKYARNGYLTLWLDCAHNYKRLDELHNKLQDKQILYRDFRSIYYAEEMKAVDKSKNGFFSRLSKKSFR